jgi:hypothetical protein
VTRPPCAHGSAPFATRPGPLRNGEGVPITVAARRLRRLLPPRTTRRVIGPLRRCFRGCRRVPPCRARDRTRRWWRSLAWIGVLSAAPLLVLAGDKPATCALGGNVRAPLQRRAAARLVGAVGRSASTRRGQRPCDAYRALHMIAVNRLSRCERPAPRSTDAHPTARPTSTSAASSATSPPTSTRSSPNDPAGPRGGMFRVSSRTPRVTR